MFMVNEQFVAFCRLIAGDNWLLNGSMLVEGEVVTEADANWSFPIPLLEEGILEADADWLEVEGTFEEVVALSKCKSDVDGLLMNNILFDMFFLCVVESSR